MLSFFRPLRHITCLLLLLSLATSSAFAQKPSKLASQFLQNTIDFLNLAVNNAPLSKEDPEAFRQILQKELDPWVSFNAFTRGVMGKFYKQASPEQANAFQRTVQKSLIETYAEALDRIDPKSIKIDKFADREDQKRATERRRQISLMARIKNGSNYSFKYSISRDKDGEWRMRNILFGGVNLGLSFRSRFQAAFNDPARGGSIQKVIDNWE